MNKNLIIFLLSILMPIAMTIPFVILKHKFHIQMPDSYWNPPNWMIYKLPVLWVELIPSIVLLLIQKHLSWFVKGASIVILAAAMQIPIIFAYIVFSCGIGHACL